MITPNRWKTILLCFRRFNKITKNWSLRTASLKTSTRQTHEKLIAESKLANSKVKFSSKHKVQPDKVSPRTVDIKLSGPCRQDPLSALCASVKKEDDVASEDEYSGSENSCSSNNDESTDSDDSYPPRLITWWNNLLSRAETRTWTNESLIRITQELSVLVRSPFKDDLSTEHF